jgi:hypothetical protein
MLPKMAHRYQFHQLKPCGDGGIDNKGKIAGVKKALI